MDAVAPAAVSPGFEPDGRGPSTTRGAGRGRRTRLSARGEPFLWLLAAGQAAALLMIAGLLGIILYQGTRTFWPRPILSVVLDNGELWLGEPIRRETVRLEALSPGGAPEQEDRVLLRTGNYDLLGDDTRWIPVHRIKVEDRPADVVLLERLEWGPFLGFVAAVEIEGQPPVTGPAARERLLQELPRALTRRSRIAHLEKSDLGEVNRSLEKNRLRLRRAQLSARVDAQDLERLQEQLNARNAELEKRHEELSALAGSLRTEDSRYRVHLRAVGGQTKEIRISEIVRVFRPNALGAAEKLHVYASRWWEYLSSDPREANTEGGVWPAIFGTVSMTLLLALFVAPLGVMAALYLREYATQGLLVSAVRIAVNNLAGVPSIVFGVFGLGFFCYAVGGRIDEVFFAERLPSPTFGTGGLLWASLTLALMTVPVVIVATEEALAAVPRSLREGAYACGASKWQMIRHVVLPRAMPGILTGLVLAMARGAGEVAPLMITGVVKLAPELPVDGVFPFVHLERSFMHLGFHIYDVGFQSRNAEAGKPMVFTTTLLLIGVILLLNISVIRLRARLRRRHTTSAI